MGLYIYTIANGITLSNR